MDGKLEGSGGGGVAAATVPVRKAPFLPHHFSEDHSLGSTRSARIVPVTSGIKGEGAFVILPQVTSRGLG